MTSTAQHLRALADSIGELDVSISVGSTGAVVGASADDACLIAARLDGHRLDDQTAFGLRYAVLHADLDGLPVLIRGLIGQAGEVAA